MNAKRLLDKNSIQSSSKSAKRERSFEFSLPTLVTGLDAAGNEFKEHTELASISSQEAILRLNSRVVIGSKLNLSLEIPKTFLLENHLKLEISGRVCFVKADQNGTKKQLIALRLDKNYKIHSISS